MQLNITYDRPTTSSFTPLFTCITENEAAYQANTASPSRTFSSLCPTYMFNSSGPLTLFHIQYIYDLYQTHHSLSQRVQMSLTVKHSSHTIPKLSYRIIRVINSHSTSHLCCSVKIYACTKAVSGQLVG